jgi:uncharacterized RDD family membrane protein YckC
VRCPHCGLVTFPHAANCKQCGRALAGAGPGAPAPPQGPVAAPPAAPPDSRWGTALPEEIATQLDPEALDLEGLSLPETVPQAGGQARGEEEGAEAAAEAPPIRAGGFWRRTMAGLVDTTVSGGLALLAGTGAVVVAAGGGKLAGRLDPTTDLLAAVAAMLAVAGVSLAYYTVFTGAWGQTPGKMLFGLTVVRADGRPVGYGRAAWRWGISWVSLALFGLGVLLIAVTPRKRALHDLLAGTAVLREAPGSS